MPEDINDWKSEMDARTLIEAESIKKDVSRLEKAKFAAMRISEKLSEDAKNAKKVTNSKKGGKNGFSKD
jgi:hypothetical protein